jgi:hypothetical protein
MPDPERHVHVSRFVEDEGPGVAAAGAHPWALSRHVPLVEQPLAVGHGVAGTPGPVDVVKSPTHTVSSPLIEMLYVKPWVDTGTDTGSARAAAAHTARAILSMFVLMARLDRSLPGTGTPSERGLLGVATVAARSRWRTYAGGDRGLADHLQPGTAWSLREPSGRAVLRASRRRPLSDAHFPRWRAGTPSGVVSGGCLAGLGWLALSWFDGWLPGALLLAWGAAARLAGAFAVAACQRPLARR